MGALVLSKSTFHGNRRRRNADSILELVAPESINVPCLLEGQGKILSCYPSGTPEESSLGTRPRTWHSHTVPSKTLHLHPGNISHAFGGKTLYLL